MVEQTTVSPAVSADAIAAALRTTRFRYSSERQLQALLTEHLTSLGWPVRREVSLAAGERIDLLIGRVGIEVKTKGSASAVSAQLARYDRTGELDELVLVSTLRKHSSIRFASAMTVTVVVLPWS